MTIIFFFYFYYQNLKYTTYFTYSLYTEFSFVGAKIIYNSTNHHKNGINKVITNHQLKFKSWNLLIDNERIAGKNTHNIITKVISDRIPSKIILSKSTHIAIQRNNNHTRKAIIAVNKKLYNNQIIYCFLHKTHFVENIENDGLNFIFIIY